MCQCEKVRNEISLLWLVLGECAGSYILNLFRKQDFVEIIFENIFIVLI